MRKIKFRGKRMDNGEWVYGYLMQMYSPKRLFIGEWKNLSNEARIKDELFSGYTEVIPETVGQFTGLKDSKGVEIYEHDEVKGMYGEQLGGEFQEYRFKVSFDRGSFVIENNFRTKSLRDARIDKSKCEIYFCDRGHNNIPDQYLLIKDIEVIGNIHESELKGGKK